MYRVAVGHWGIQPSEFWKMAPLEWWWLYEAKVKPHKSDRLSPSEVERYKKMLEEG